MPFLFLFVMLLGRLIEISSTATPSSNYFKARQLKPGTNPNDVSVSDRNISAQRQHALNLIRETYPNEYYNSTISHHFFLRMAPIELQNSIQQLIWNGDILRSIRSTQPLEHIHPWIIIPDVYHEIYLMRPEMDFIDANKAHYDGILKMLPSTTSLLTLRSLTYLEGNPANFVAVTSMVNYTTDIGSTVIIDFNRELHYAIINNDNYTATTTARITTSPSQYPPRVIIKAAVHLFGPNTSMTAMISQIIAHRIIFFAIKSLRIAYESSEGSSLLMILENMMRTLNKIHTLLPLMAIATPLVSILVLGPIRCPLQLLPYIIHVLLICVWRFSPFQIKLLRSVAISLAIARAVFVKTITGALNNSSPSSSSTRVMISLFLFPKTIILHLSWLGICHYMEMNAEMVRCILFAPIPDRIELDTV